MGNWAGVTVERREGRIEAAGERAVLVDLPGIYSLAAYTLEELSLIHIYAAPHLQHQGGVAVQAV